jgi:3-oxoacyl-[acyl-carrier protein] reductase
MTNSYENKTVIITGSSRGIGAATAEYFAKKNFNVVINYLTGEQEANTLKEKLINEYGIKAITIKADVSKEEDCLKILEETKANFNTIDVLVNNAGIAIDTTLEDKTVENFRKILDVNLIGVFLMCKHIGTYMKDVQGFGSIVNISSTNGIDSFYSYSLDYDASKAGVISLNHNFASLYAPTVRVNCIAPGWVNTEMNKELGPEYEAEESKGILLGRFADPSEIAQVIYFVGEEATYMNDSIIKVDGGKA